MPEKLSLVEYQKRLFEIFDEFFTRATGKTYCQFATFQSFASEIRSNAETIAARGELAFTECTQLLAEHYSAHSTNAFVDAKELGGLRLVLGGSSRFKESQFNTVTKSLLYADTVLVPDPVLPWLESERSEEQFRHVLLLESVFAILHLKPLVDAELRNMPVVVFPSFEKSLEENDADTEAGISRLCGDVFSHFLNENLSSMDEAFDFVMRFPDEFMKTADDLNLFVAPGANIDDDLGTQLRLYHEEIETWRNADWLERFKEFKPEQKISYAITERLGAQFHLVENSLELNAHPILPTDLQSHYFSLVAETNASRLQHLQLINENQRALITGISEKRLKWLEGVPIGALVDIRKNNENIQFRARLLGITKQIHDAKTADSGRIAAELSHEIELAMQEHDTALENLVEKYNQKHQQTAVTAYCAWGATLMPTLAPAFGFAAPFGIAAKYGWDKIDQNRAVKQHAKSLFGVLTATYDGHRKQLQKDA